MASFAFVIKLQHRNHFLFLETRTRIVVGTNHICHKIMALKPYVFYCTTTTTVKNIFRTASVANTNDPNVCKVCSESDATCTVVLLKNSSETIRHRP